MHAEVLQVALRDDGAQRVRSAAYAELERRAVYDVRDDVLRYLDIFRRGFFGRDGRHRAVLALYDHGDVGDMDALVVCAVDLGQLVVDLDDDGVSAAYHIKRRSGGEREVEVAVLVHRRGADVSHVDMQKLAVIPREVAKYHGGEVGAAFVDKAAVITGAMPDVVAEVFALRVALNSLNGAVHYLRTDLDVKKLISPLGQRSVAQRGEGGAVAVFHPVAALDELGGILRGAELRFVLAYEVHILSSVKQFFTHIPIIARPGFKGKGRVLHKSGNMGYN